MRYHNITKDDMLNGEGLRVVLWVAGCSHNCPECHNPVTWDIRGGIPFDQAAKDELFEELQKDYVSGVTLSGGDDKMFSYSYYRLSFYHRQRNENILMETCIHYT